MAGSSLFRLSLTEKHRPRTWAEVVGQEKIVTRLQGMLKRTGLAGRAYFLAGGSGQGKTTIARLISAEVADEFMIREVDASALTVAELRELERESQVSGWGAKTGRAYIINECHALRKDVIRQLLVTLERIPSHVCWVFTTTNDNEEALFEDCLDASPLLSRCVELRLARRNLAEAFAKRAKEIAEAKGLDGRALKDYVRLASEKMQKPRALRGFLSSGCFMKPLP